MVNAEAFSFREVQFPRIRWTSLHELCSLIQAASANLSPKPGAQGGDNEEREAQAARTVTGRKATTGKGRGTKRDLLA
jgi:hypothetical protein